VLCYIWKAHIAFPKKKNITSHMRRTFFRPFHLKGIRAYVGWFVLG
jgi:hypothetical protein